MSQPQENQPNPNHETPRDEETPPVDDNKKPDSPDETQETTSATSEENSSADSNRESPTPSDKEATEEDKGDAGETSYRRSHWSISAKFNLVLIILASFVIFVEVNYLNARHHSKWDLSANQQYTLSDKTKKYISGEIQQPVKLILLLPKSSSLTQYMRDLLDEYQNLNSKIETFHLDVFRNPAKLKELQQEYKGIDENTALIVAMGHKKKYLSKLDLTRRGGRQESSIRFKGEEALTSALINLNQDKKTIIYFTTGHGEPLISTQGRGVNGIYRAAQALESNNMAVREISLATKDVPEDCDVLVAVNPRQKFSLREEDRILTYLQRGGRFFLMADPNSHPGLKLVLKRYQISLKAGRIVEEQGTYRGVLVRNFSNHEITRPLDNLLTLHFNARPVEWKRGGPNQDGFELMYTSPQSRTLALRANQKRRKYERIQLAGPKKFTLAVAVTREELRSEEEEDKAKPPSPESQKPRRSKIIVMGNGDFIYNGFGNSVRRVWGLEAERNKDLFMNSIYWLSDNNQLISLEGREVVDRHVSLRPQDLNRLWLLSVIFPPLFGIFLGISVWLMRSS